MHTREISKETWKSFLDDFSRQHEFWRVSLEVTNPEAEAQAEIEEMPLIRIGVSDDNVAVNLRNHDSSEVMKEIRNPAHLWLEETEEGAHKSLQMESADGTRTVISFRSAVLPESMDGILDDQAQR